MFPNQKRSKRAERRSSIFVTIPLPFMDHVCCRKPLGFGLWEAAVFQLIYAPSVLARICFIVWFFALTIRPCRNHVLVVEDFPFWTKQGPPMRISFLGLLCTGNWGSSESRYITYTIIYTYTLYTKTIIHGY